jgi:two-component system nitrogen regulation sensor histidine kinase NtrY
MSTVVTRPSRSWVAYAVDIALGRVATLVVASLALLMGVATFLAFAGRVRLGDQSSFAVDMSLADFAALLLLIIVLAGRITRVVLERRRGAAGAGLHVRLVFFFGVVAAFPAFLVAAFATVFFIVGVQTWFNQRVQTALNESTEVAQGYLAEHDNEIHWDALTMAEELSQIAANSIDDPNAFLSYLVNQASDRELTLAEIFNPQTGEIQASAGLFGGMGAAPPPASEVALAQDGQVHVTAGDNGRVEDALIKLDTAAPEMLLIERPIDPAILEHVNRTEQAASEYQRLEKNRTGLEISFALIFAVIALLVLSALIAIGLVIANQIARPIVYLIEAAERVREGDLGVRVPETETGDDMAGLSRAFNRMTGQLAAQRTQLMEANLQLDERRRFTETVLAGVSAGVIGLDRHGVIDLPNRAASDLLRIDLSEKVGLTLAEVVPEFSGLVAAVMAGPERPATAQIEHGPAMGKRVLLVRIGAEMKGGQPDGFIVTFDDVTELLSAQRKAAWADVARRIAHEIKNPLTPIQLSAERLKRRFAKEITSDPDSFTQCADTIVRHVGDIGRMVDEFSSFARMPVPVMRVESLARIVREAVVLQRVAHAGIEFEVVVEDEGVRALCDRRLLGQALTNLLQNATDAVGMREGASHVTLRLAQRNGNAVMSVTDDGVGLPAADRDRLTEPYVTHKPKGTGLGLAIVRKIMEDHGGSLELAEAPDGVGAMVTLTLPAEESSL